MQRSLACPRCSNTYAVKDGVRSKKRPLLLACGHTFCESCLCFIIRERKTMIPCPLCFATTKVPNGEAGVKDLCLDRYVTGMLVHGRKALIDHEIEELDRLTKANLNLGQKKKTDTEKNCKECTKRPATTRCLKCDTTMCAACFQKVHSLSNALRQHQATPLTDDCHVEVLQMCKEHTNRPLEYYCEDDNTVICSRCVIVGIHKGHNISSIEDKNKQIVTDMEPNLQVANHVLKRLKYIDKDLSKLVPASRVDVKPALKDLNTHFQHLHGLLQVRENQLERQIIDTLHGSQASFEKMRDELQNEYKQLDVTIKAAHRIINNNDEVIVNAKEILEKLAGARDIPCILEVLQENQTEDSLGFIPGASLDTALLEHGSVESSSTQERYRLHTLRDQPEKFTEEIGSVECEIPDNISVISASTTTSQSDDVVIEEEQEIIFDDSSSLTSLNSENSSRRSSVSKPEKKKTNKMPSKPKIRGSNENVIVTHISNPCKFIVQLKKESSKLTSLSYAMQQWCNSPAGKKQAVTEVAVDDLVLAKYTLDGQWYRARVKSVLPSSAADSEEEENFEKTKVEVLYIDFGNMELLSVRRLVNMQTKFMKNPEFSIECSLYNIVPIDKEGGWKSDAVQTLAKMVENKVMMMKVIREENNILQVDLCKPPEDSIVDDRPMSVRDALVFLEYANLESPYSVPDPRDSHQAPSRSFLSPDRKDEGESCQVVVTYSGTPTDFVVQELEENFDYLVSMMTRLQDYYSSKKSDSLQIFCPHIRMICVARFSGDDQWYRAQVVDLPGHKCVTVLLVDYGIQETVELDQIRKVVDQFCVLPCQGLKCALADIEPLNVNEGWTGETVRRWSETVCQEVFEMKVITQETRMLNVVLRPMIESDCPAQPLNSLFVETGLALSTGKRSEVVVEVKSGMSEYVPRLSYTTAEANFPEPCDLDHNPVYWKTRHAKSRPRYTEDVILTPPNSPEPTSASSAEKNQKDASSTVVVNKETASPVKTPTKKSPDKSPKKSGQKQSVAKRISLEAPNSGDSAATSMPPVKVTGEKTKSSREKESVKPVTASVDVVVSHFVSPDEFHVQLASAGKSGLNQLMVDLDQTYKDSEVTPVSWKKDSYCVALAKDGHWYRAKITNTLHKLYEVYMLDYGFTETVGRNNLRSILRQYRSFRCFSFRCHLANLIPAGGMEKWSKTACEFMEGKIFNKKLYISKKGNANKAHSLPIDLMIEDYIEDTALEPGRKVVTSIVDLMKESGLAIPMPKKRREVEEEKKVYPVLFYKKAEAEVKTGDRVMPVYVDYDAVIHCYTMEGDDIFQAMCDNLHQKFKDSDPDVEDQEWVKGQACAAFYEKDGQWHRASIVQLEPIRAQVHFIDYGNTEWISFDMMRIDIEEFVHIPQQTFLCKLHNVKSVDDQWPVTTLEYMHKQLVNKYCIVTVIEKHGYMDEHMTVNLELNGADIGSTLVQYGLVQRGDYVTDQVHQSEQILSVIEENNPFITMAPKPVGETIGVQVTHVELPNIVYVQLMEVDINLCASEKDKKYYAQTNKYLKQLQKMSQDLNMLAPTLPIIPTPKVGLQCVAQFGLDNCWYRALVIHLYPDTKQLLVLFVDYGNSEVITVHKMRALPKKYLSLPCQASRYQLADIVCPESAPSWTKEALYSMMTTLGNKTLVARVTNQVLACIELFLPDDVATETLVYQNVIDAGHVMYQPSTERQNDAMVAKAVESTEATTSCTTVNTETTETSQETEDKVLEEEDTEQEKEEDLDESVSTITGDANVAVVDVPSEKSKSWAEMVEEGSMADIDEIPNFEDVEGEKKQDSRKGRQKDENVEVVLAEEEAFE